MATPYARQAIVTKSLPVTNTRPARIVATTGSGFRRIYSIHALENSIESRGESSTFEYRHFEAAKLLAQELGWNGKLVGGTTPSGYAFVFADVESTIIVK